MAESTNTAEAAQRVMVVGFDAMDHTLATELAHKGEMPALAKLIAKSPHARVNNPVGFVVGAIWPSFWSGRWPASHGRHCYVQLEPGTYDFVTVTPWGIDGVPYWSPVAARGRTICSVDVPFTVPIPDAGGVQVFDWGSHDRRIDFQTVPAAEVERIEATVGLHPIQPRCDTYARSDRWQELRDGLVHGAESRTDIVLDHLKPDPADLISVVYGESHCVGHQFWSVHDPAYVDHDPAMRTELGDPIVDVYRTLDAQLQRLLDANPHALTYVLLSHGMGPHHDGDHLLPEILRRLDQPEKVAARSELLVRLRHRAKALVRPLVPFSRRQARFQARKRSVQQRRLAERAGQRFFHHVNNTMYSGIRINLEGREPDGLVQLSELEQLERTLITELESLVHTGTGRRAVDRVLRVADLYDGPHLHELPDLVVDWNRDAPISDVTSPRIGRVTGKYASSRTGDHRLDGLLLVTGPGSEAVSLEDRVDLVDLAPSIAAHFGVDLADIDGKPIPSLAHITV